jgi:MoaA/NifB/PqqE/SkfB family radical SAM enzyme
MARDVRDLHTERVARWCERRPGSAHRRLGLDELEERKGANEALNLREQEERPEVCASYPSFLTVGNTHKCNLTCGMCFKQLDDVENMTLPDMGMERFERIAHELFPHVRTVALSVTGEPLVSRTILEELELLGTYAVRAWITSNGMPLAKPGLIEALMPATETLVISMDGASPETFDAIRRRADFAKVVRNLERFLAARDALPPGAHRPRLHVNHILQRRNLLELPRLVELTHHLRVDHVAVDHVYVHDGLNPEDSVLAHPRLVNRVLEEARAAAARLGVELELPEPFDVEGAPPDAPFEPVLNDTLRAQARVRLASVRFDPAIHERWNDEHRWRVARETRDAGGGNAEYVERLLDERQLLGHLRWGVPQLGPSLIPAADRKVSECTYPWRESFLEYNGVVAPCCNPAVDAGRVLGHLDDAPSFREIWNGEAYRRLRASLASGACYRFCRTCYLYEPPTEADWGTNETWLRARVALRPDEPAPIGAVPPGRRVVVTEVRSGPVPPGARLEIYAGTRRVAEVAPTNGRIESVLAGLELADEAVVTVRLVGAPEAGEVAVELVAFVV